MQQSIIKSSLLAGILVILASRVQASAMPGFNECMFNGRFYDIGESFHPIVNLRGREYEAVCYNCTCQPTTIAQCLEVLCPIPDCESPIRVDGQCCPVCYESGVDSGNNQCVYEGLSFPHGELFHPPSMVKTYEEEMSNGSASTAKETSVNPFCTQCECTNGSVKCADNSVNCPSLSCDVADAILTEGKCCLECPELPAPPKVPNPACTDYDGAIYATGETWNPYYPGYGRAECVNCTCTVERGPVCEREPCPEPRFCEPGEELPDIVVCCPVCRKRPHDVPTDEPHHSVSISTPSEAPAAENGTQTTNITIQLIPCETLNYIINIFKHETKDSLAIESSETSVVVIYTWSYPSEGTVMKHEMSVDSIAFRQMEDFTFVGKTLLRRVNALSNQPKKRERIRMCTSNCADLVITMLRTINGQLQCKSTDS